MTCDGQQLYNETLFPVGGKIQLRDLSNLVTPYARQSLVVSLAISIRENVTTGTGGSSSLSATIIYCKADFNTILVIIKNKNDWYNCFLAYVVGFFSFG